MKGEPPVVRFHDHVRALLDDLQEGLEGFGGLVRTAILGIARVKMHDSRAGLRRAQGRLSDFFGRNRQMGRH